MIALKQGPCIPTLAADQIVLRQSQNRKGVHTYVLEIPGNRAAMLLIDRIANGFACSPFYAPSTRPE